MTARESLLRFAFRLQAGPLPPAVIPQPPPLGFNTLSSQFNNKPVTFSVHVHLYPEVHLLDPSIVPDAATCYVPKICADFTSL